MNTFILRHTQLNIESKSDSYSTKRLWGLSTFWVFLNNLILFLVKPRSVYAKDVMDIAQFPVIKGVVLNEDDQDFFRKFSTGCVSISFQNEVSH